MVKVNAPLAPKSGRLLGIPVARALLGVCVVECHADEVLKAVQIMKSLVPAHIPLAGKLTGLTKTILKLIERSLTIQKLRR